MPQPIIQVDAFADRPFSGNPAAVCVMDGPRDEAWMKNVAMEMNLSETAFLHPQDGGNSLRWFTPAVEVALCGHATLASAHVLWETGALAAGDEARFHTKSGLLTCRRDGEWIWMDFPAKPEEPAGTVAGLAEALGVTPVYVGRSHFDVIVEVASEGEVRAVEPDIRALRAVQARGVIVTAKGSGDGYDFISRFFAPNAGVDEDPVTGSAHCVLAPYWAKKLGRDELTGYQASRRGGTVRVRAAGDRVHLGGRAVTILRGELV
ncbi:MAG: PhzF family phenazine biosynthesis protein [Gemmatimonadetes bacterium]|nr:PhzF family phenazine biosynthesis protein [Gemmatimonadota bacterium]